MPDNEPIQPLKLSATDEQQAVDGFTAWLDKKNILLLVIPGEGPEIDSMINAASSLRGTVWTILGIFLVYDFEKT